MVYAAGYIAFKEPFLFALTDDLSSLHPCMNEYFSAISKGKLKCPQKRAYKIYSACLHISSIQKYHTRLLSVLRKFTDGFHLDKDLNFTCLRRI